MSALNDNKKIFKLWHENLKAVFNGNNKKILNDDKSSNGFYSFMNEFKNFLYESIHSLLEKNKFNFQYEATIRYYCNYIGEKLLPICNKKIKYYQTTKIEDSHILLNKWLDLEDDLYALASFRNIKMLAYYLERGNPKKIWRDTMELFDNFFDYAQKLVFGQKIELIRASYFPGAGKSYGANVLCAFWWGYDSDMSILRITYSSDLCAEFIRQISQIIGSKEYRKVFPKFDVGGDVIGAENKDLYSEFSVEVGFKFKFSKVKNFYASTRDGQTTGKRGKVLIIDDLTKGADEAHDEKFHKRMEYKFDTEWASRADSSYQPVIALGTMWSELDLLNKLFLRALKDTDNNLSNDKKYKYTKIAYNVDGSINSVFIATPILDYDTDQSTCPKRYTTNAMRKKRDHMDKPLWDAVYQQRPTPPQEFMFNYDNLLTYTDNTMPKELLKNNERVETFAFIDPTRTGIDFFAMGIFRRYTIDNNNKSKWHLIDCVFEQKPSKELIYEVCAKIINYNINRMGYENNIDVTFDELIKIKLKELGHTSPKIDSFFSHGQSKATKIRDSAYGMKTEIVYPHIRMYSLSSPMGKGMNQFTSWHLSQKAGDHDDFPDMIAMFVKYYCDNKRRGNNMTVLTNKAYRLK